MALCPTCWKYNATFNDLSSESAGVWNCEEDHWFNNEELEAASEEFKDMQAFKCTMTGLNGTRIYVERLAENVWMCVEQIKALGLQPIKNLRIEEHTE